MSVSGGRAGRTLAGARNFFDQKVRNLPPHPLELVALPAFAKATARPLPKERVRICGRAYSRGRDKASADAGEMRPYRSDVAKAATVSDLGWEIRAELRLMALL